MAIMPIQHVSAGMCVADAVKDRNGRLLIAAGTVLQTKHLQILKTWGVHEINVAQADTQPETIPVTSEVLSKASLLINEKFCHNDASIPVVAELKSIATTRLAEQLMRNHEHP